MGAILDAVIEAAQHWKLESKSHSDRSVLVRGAGLGLLTDYWRDPQPEPLVGAVFSGIAITTHKAASVSLYDVVAPSAFWREFWKGFANACGWSYRIRLGRDTGRPISLCVQPRDASAGSKIVGRSFRDIYSRHSHTDDRPRPRRRREPRGVGWIPVRMRLHRRDRVWKGDFSQPNRVRSWRQVRPTLGDDKFTVVLDPRNLIRDWETDRKSTRLNSSHSAKSRMPSSA